MKTLVASGIAFVGVLVAAVFVIRHGQDWQDPRAYCVSGFSITANQRDIAEKYLRRGWGDFPAASVSIADIGRFIVDDVWEGDHQYRYSVADSELEGFGIGNNCGAYDILPSHLP